MENSICCNEITFFFFLIQKPDVNMDSALNIVTKNAFQFEFPIKIWYFVRERCKVCEKFSAYKPILDQHMESCNRKKLEILVEKLPIGWTRAQVPRTGGVDLQTSWTNIQNKWYAKTAIEFTYKEKSFDCRIQRSKWAGSSIGEPVERILKKIEKSNFIRKWLPSFVVLVFFNV